MAAVEEIVKQLHRHLEFVPEVWVWKYHTWAERTHHSGQQLPSLTISALFLVWVAASLRPHMFSEKIRKKYSFPTTSSVIVMQLRW